MRGSRGQRALLTLILVVATGCDPAEFRPAKGVKDLPSAKTAYRVQEDQESCDDIGFVIKASSVDDIAETAANHGGTHYRVLDDFAHSTVETDTVGMGRGGVFVANSSSAVVKHHKFTARVFRCQ